MKFNPQTLLEVGASMNPETYTATPSDEAFVDTRGYSECLVILATGTFTSTATLDVVVHESAASNGSGSTAITGATFAQVATGATDDTVYVGRINLQDRLRYLGTVATFGGAGNAPVCCLIIPIGPYATSIADQTYAFTVGD